MEIGASGEGSMGGEPEVYAYGVDAGIWGLDKGEWVVHDADGDEPAVRFADTGGRKDSGRNGGSIEEG